MQIIGGCEESEKLKEIIPDVNSPPVLTRQQIVS